MSLRLKNVILIVFVIALTAFPLLFRSGAEFSGADDQAEQVITQVKPDYTPWFSSVWEPPSGEVESFFFALQAAIGAGFTGYYLGYMKGRKKNAED